LNHPDTRAKKTSPRQNKPPQLIEIRAGGDFSSILKPPCDYGQDDRSAMRRTALADIANTGAIGTLRVETGWPEE